MKTIWSQIGEIDLNEKPDGTSTTRNFATDPDLSTSSAVVGKAIRDAKAQKATDAMSEIGPTTIATNYAKDHDTAGPNPTAATKQVGVSWKEPVTPYTKSTESTKSSESNESGGSQTGTGGNKFNWGAVGNLATSIGKAASAYAASKRQMDLAKQTKVPLEQAPVRTSFRYKDSGIDLAYNNAINQQQSFARNFKSADSALNAAVGLQTADKTTQLELERGMKKAQLFGEQMNAHNDQLRAERIQDAAIANTNAQRLAQKHNALLQQKGAYIAQNQGIAQGLMSDIAGIGQQAIAGKRALAAFDAKNTYSNNMSGLRKQYDAGIANGSITSGTTFDT